MRSVVQPVLRDVGNAIGVPFGGGINWNSYFKKNCSFYAYKREGTELVDYFGNNAQILFPVFSTTSSKNKHAYIKDNGALDIGSNDFTFGMWVNVLDNAPSNYYFLGGKPIQGSGAPGRYHFSISSSKKFVTFVDTTGTDISITANNEAQVNTWYFLLLEIDQTNKKARFYINNELQDSEKTWSGTIPNLDNKYYFIIGQGNGGLGNGAMSNYPPYAYFSEVGIYNRLLTDEEKISWYNRINPPSNPKGYWLMNNIYYLIEYDISGNGYNLTYSKTWVNYNVGGSDFYLKHSFKIYATTDFYNNKLYLPVKYLNGNDCIISGYEEYPEGMHSASSGFLNLPNCAILFSGDEWDRSDTSLYEDEARSNASYYDSSNPKIWHIDELNNLKFQTLAKNGHKGRNFVKITDNSYKSRKLLKYICTFKEDKYDTSDWDKLMAYAGDYKVTANSYLENEFVIWKYVPVTNEYILIERGSKRLKWIDSTTDKFALSVDCGDTYPYEINSPFNGQKPCFAYIFDNGNILVASYNGIIRVSTDNLQSWTTPTVLDINGNPFVATNNCYQTMLNAGIDEVNKDDINLVIWGCYSNEAGTQYSNINIFYTIDKGLIIKSCYKAGVTNPPSLPAKHIHTVKYRALEDVFWVSTGDYSSGTSEVNWLKGSYDWENDLWSWSYFVGDPSSSGTTYYKVINFYFDETNGYVYFAGDDTASATGSRGFLKCPLSNIDKDNFIKVVTTSAFSNGFICDGDEVIFTANIESSMFYNKITLSKTGLDGKYFNLYLFGRSNTVFCGFDSFIKNAENFYRIKIYTGPYGSRIVDYLDTWLKIK